MQKVRRKRIDWVAAPQVLSANRTHTESLGHAFGSQLNCVQYPPGWVVSHRRSPVTEQSVEMVQASPIFLEQPAPTLSRASARVNQPRWHVPAGFRATPSVRGGQAELAAPVFVRQEWP
jgi:hypothetical protein